MELDNKQFFMKGDQFRQLKWYTEAIKLKTKPSQDIFLVLASYDYDTDYGLEELTSLRLFLCLGKF